jgi:hypothetical protein
MSIFDLLLILLVLATAMASVGAAVLLFMRRWTIAWRFLAGVFVAWIVYLGAGALVAVRTPQHIMALGEDRCFDEMCFAVMGWNRTPSTIRANGATNGGRSFYIVYIRISNRSRGRAQREIGRKGVLIDRSGQVYEESKEAVRALTPVNGTRYPGLDAEVGPGQSLETELVFDLPTEVDYPGFALASDLTINPARIVIGDEESFLRWPTVWPLG